MTNITESMKGRAVLGLAAGAFGILAALAALPGAEADLDDPSSAALARSSQDISGNCDEAEHADDPQCVGVAVPGTDSTSTTVPGGSTSTTVTTATTAPTGAATGAPASGVRTVSAGDAGFVTVAFDGTGLQVRRTTPNAGWSAEVEHASGREVEVTFTNGSRRIDVNVQLEDGQIRERVRERIEERDNDEGRVDSSGPGSGEGHDVDSSGPGSGDDEGHERDDASSGPGSGDDDRSGDD